MTELMDSNEMLLILKRRERKLKKRITKERKESAKLKYKSIRLRGNSCLPARIGFFTDHLQELQLVIRLLNRQVTPSEFVIDKNGDKLDILLGAFR